jgi:alginate O-acetyltransferase complex protein AlgI
LNLVIVFFLCGLWHGASWTFVIWGLYHGLFLVLERTRFGRALDAAPRPFRHGYTLLVVMVGWVLFRAENFGQALNFLSNMAGVSSPAHAGQRIARYWSNELGFALVCGAIFSMPAWNWVVESARRIHGRMPVLLRPVAQAAGLGVQFLLTVALLLVSASWLAGGTYNPFIYFRF